MSRSSSVFLAAAAARASSVTCRGCVHRSGGSLVAATTSNTKSATPNGAASVVMFVSASVTHVSSQTTVTSKYAVTALAQPSYTSISPRYSPSRSGRSVATRSS